MKPYLVIYFEHKSILRPSYALIKPASNFKLATVRAHVMESFEPELNYFNNTKVKVPKICTATLSTITAQRTIHN